MDVTIRQFIDRDADALVEILKRNNQYEYPNTEGPDAMRKVAECDAALFLIVVINSTVVGCIRAIYDGSRAMIHLLSVHPEFQNRGIGTNLVNSVVQVLNDRGALTISVTVTDSSRVFWDKLGFNKLPVYLMIRDINIKAITRETTA